MAEDTTTPTGLPFSNPATSMKGVHGGYIVPSHVKSPTTQDNGADRRSHALDSEDKPSTVQQGTDPSARASTASASYADVQVGRPSSSSSVSATASTSAGHASTVPPSVSNSSMAQTRPSNPRTRSSSSITSTCSAGSSSTTRLNAKGHTAINASPAGSMASQGLKGMHEDEIEASLRQWRNHVFPSLKAGNYVSPGQETPDKDPIHPLIEPILPSIFTSPTSNNLKCVPVVYQSGKHFLEAIVEASTYGSDSKSSLASNRDNGAIQVACHTVHNGTSEGQVEQEGEDYESNWRLEMVIGQTRDLIHNNENADGIWIALWSGEQATNTRLLEFCLMKLPSRPLVLSSPIPISLLPTALLQDRMQTLLNALLTLPSNKNNPSPFSLVMGPTRVVEAFLLHYDSHPALLTTANNTLTGTASSPAYGQGYSTGDSVEGMFEQSILQNDRSPYPLKLSHPKYTAAMRAASARVSGAQTTSSDSTSATMPSSGFTPSGSDLSSNMTPALSKLTKEAQEIARIGSTRPERIPSTTSSTSVAPTSVGSAQQQQQQQQGGFSESQGAGDSALVVRQSSSSSSGNNHIMTPYQNSNIPQQHQRQIFHHSAAAGRTVKPLLHTRAKDIPPAVSLSEGFAVRLAQEKDDLRTLVSLFQAYSQTLDHTLEESAARRALQKAMSNKSVWIYHIYSQSLPGLSLIAGFLTTERKRPYSGTNVRSKSEGGKGKGSVAITAVFTDDPYRSRGVAESLVRTATRYYLVDLEYDYISVYVDPRNETTCRVFSRVGYGIIDREVNEEIPIKLIRNALIAQWEEEKEKYRNMSQNMGNNQFEDEDQDQTHELSQNTGSEDIPVEDMPENRRSSHSVVAARNTLSLLKFAKKEISAHTDEISSTASRVHAETGSLIPTDEENEAALQAENGKPLCTSSEEWQVVSLRSREIALIESRSRVRGHTRRDDNKRLSSEGPWH